MACVCLSRRMYLENYEFGEGSTDVGQHSKYEEDPIGSEKPVMKYTFVNQRSYCSENSWVCWEKHRNIRKAFVCRNEDRCETEHL